MAQLLLILVYSCLSLYLKCYKFLVILFEQEPGLILCLLNYNTPFIIAVLEVYTCYQGEDNKKTYRWTFVFRTCTINYNKKMFVNSDASYSWFYNCTEVKNLLILVQKILWSSENQTARVALRSRKTTVYLTAVDCTCRFCRKLHNM